MGNDLSKPRIKNKGKTNSTSATPVGIVTENVQSPLTQGAKSQATNERNPTYPVTLDSSIYFFDTVRQISEATELLAPLKAVCGVIVKALEATRAVHANKEEWGNLADEIQAMQDTIAGQITRLQKDDKHPYSPLLTDPAIVEPLKRFTTSLGEIFESSSDALKQSNKGSNTLNRVLNVRIDAEKIQQYKEATNRSFDKFMVAINLFTAHYTKEQGDIAAIRALKVVNNPGGNQHQTCTKDTRVQLLHDIRTWADDPATDKQIFWIADRAGTGKSTVAKQIVTEWEKAAKPVVPFFFSITAADTMSNAKFCSTVAVKLAGVANLGSFRTALAEVLRQDLTVETLGFEEQFKKLILSPLQTTNKPVLLVIDALDECDKRDRLELLSTLLKNLDKLPKAKVMITSRPLPDINQKLQNQPIVYSRDLRGDDPDSTTQDILRHLAHIFSNSDNLRHLQHHVSRLGKLADGLFIWASTAGKFLEESLDPDGALAAIESMNGLDDLYTRIMECAIPKNDVHSRKTVCFILQIILAAQRPLSISEIQTLLDKSNVVKSVEALGSVLSNSAEDKPVQILHPTFQEYLTDKDRSGIYFVDVNGGHNSLALGCLKALSEGLKNLKIYMNEEVRDLSPNGAQNQLSTQEVLDGNGPVIATTSGITPSIPLTLTYAATFWPNHVIALFTKARARDEIEILEEKILYLFKNHLIQWFELVVQLQGVYLCIKNLAGLERTIPVSSPTTASLTAKTKERAGWCRDGHRFLQYHQVEIKQGRIHVHKALAFTPKQSLTYQVYYNKYADCIPLVKSGVPSDWPSHQVLSGHTRRISCVEFSPDGTRVVSGSDDKTLRLWDGVTGASIGDPMEGHTDNVTCVAFSPDGTRVVSGSWDKTLRLWDGVTGASIGNPIGGHTGHVRCVRFSPDGTHVVSGSDDKTLRLWDGVTGASIGDPMIGHTDNVTCVLFSPDGTRIVSGSDDKSLRLWDGVTGASIGDSMEGHTSNVTCVAFSPDGTRVISGSRDKTLRLWDGVTGASIGNPMEGHTRYVKCVAFSPDGTRVVSGSQDNTLRLWDGVTGVSLGSPMRGRKVDDEGEDSRTLYMNSILCVAFSPDGTRIVSAPHGYTLHLWDGVTGASIGSPLEGHTSYVECVAFSPDGTRVVSGSLDQTLRLWGNVTGANIETPMKKHTGCVSCVAFSPEGTRIISGSDDCTLRLWDNVTAAVIGSPMRGHTYSVCCVSFSPDSTRVVSGSADSTLRLWDGMTGASIGGPMNGHTDDVTCVAFSPDGSRIVSGSVDGTLRMWDGVTGANIGAPMEGAGYVTCVAFSPDGALIVSASGNLRLQLWSVISCARLAIIRTKKSVTQVEFSACGSYLVSEGGIWDINTSPPSLVRNPFVPRQSSSPIRFNSSQRTIEIPGPSNLVFALPNFPVSQWVAHRSSIVLGSEDGRIMIVDCTHLL